MGGCNRDSSHIRPNHHTSNQISRFRCGLVLGRNSLPLKQLRNPFPTVRLDMSDRLRTAKEARTWFYDQGISLTDWARDHGYPRQAVYAVLSGRSRCTRGRGHQIAIDLGMKRLNEVDSPPGLELESNQQGRRAVSQDPKEVRHMSD